MIARFEAYLQGLTVMQPYAPSRAMRSHGGDLYISRSLTHVDALSNHLLPPNDINLHRTNPRMPTLQDDY